VDVGRTTDIGREILTVTVMKTSVSSDMMPFSLVKVEHVVPSSGPKRKPRSAFCWLLALLIFIPEDEGDMIL
jgi:hypothetical protein